MIPSALEFIREIAGGHGQLAVFLDYDGTLTPIVSHPEEAVLSDSMRQTLRELAARAPVVAILSGRELDDVRRRVNIDSIVYAGSHGFDIAGPHGLRRQMATEFLSNLDMAEKELHAVLGGISGARAERKRFSVAAHYRNVKENDVPKVEQAVSEVATRHRGLRRMEGKKVFELLPAIAWDKGNIRPIFIGDDRTDEDAFRALEQRGIGILVSEQSQPTGAKYSLKDPAEVEYFLRALSAHLPA